MIKDYVYSSVTGRKRYILLLAIFWLISALPLTAQEPVPVVRSNNKVVLEGKVYYVHVVKAGQTLYSIARAYNVTEKAIIIENPGTSANLSIGQVLKIPSDPGSAFEIDTRELLEGTRKHKLAEGETIYSLSRLYLVSVEEILELNPGMDINDLAIGQEILIPEKKEEAEANELSFNEEGYILHKVKKGETLYSISRFYEVNVREIRRNNPELGWGGPRSGDVIRIPQPLMTFEELYTQDTIRIDTLIVEIDTIPEIEAYTYDELLDLPYVADRVYRVVYMIPFDFNEMEPLDSVLKDIKSASYRKRLTDEYMMEKAKPQSVNFLEFFEGSLLALDAMTEAGMELDIRVYDTRKSMHRTRQILQEPDIQDADIIFGPFYVYNLELASEFSRDHNIPLVTPFISNDSLLLENPYLFQPVPSYKTEYDRNARFIGRLYDNNLIFVHEGDSLDTARIAYYKEKLFEELERYSMLETVLFKEVIVEEGNTEDLIHALNPDYKNLVILPTTDEAFASQVASRLNYELSNFDIELFGSSYWVGFDNIDIRYIHALDLHISHMKWYDYKDQDYLDFLSTYYSNFKKEPRHYTRRGSSFAVVGYDLTSYFLSALDRFGPGFILHLDDYQQDRTICDFNYQRLTEYSGFENQSMQYYYFDDSLNVRIVELPETPEIHRYFKPAEDDPLYYNWPLMQQDSAIIRED
jgi:LysM repeat protein